MAGMTLLEVLISLAIFALAVTGFSAAYVNALSAVHASSEMSRHAADWRLVRSLVVGEVNREIVEQGGELPLEEQGHIKWTVEIRPTQVLDLFEVELSGEVADGAGTPREHHEIFRVLRPTWSKADDRVRLLEAIKQQRAGRSAS